MPSLEEHKKAYNIRPKFKAFGSTDYDEDAADVLARCQTAFFAGPLHVAEHTGHEDTATRDHIREEYRVLMAVVANRNYVGKRAYKLIFVAEHPGFVLRLQSQGQKERKYSRKYRDETSMKADATVLWHMLNDNSWDAVETSTVWEAWQALVASRTLADEWLAGRCGGASLGGIRVAVVRRAKLKTCRAPGLDAGCNSPTTPRQSVPWTGRATLPTAHGTPRDSLTSSRQQWSCTTPSDLRWARNWLSSGYPQSPRCSTTPSQSRNLRGPWMRQGSTTTLKLTRMPSSLSSGGMRTSPASASV